MIRRQGSDLGPGTADLRLPTHALERKIHFLQPSMQEPCTLAPNWLRSEVRSLRSESRNPEAEAFLFPLSAVFRDVHDFVLEDEQIWRAFARQANHIFVVVFDPAVDGLPVHQFERDWLLLLAQRLQESSFLECIFRRRSPAALCGIGISLWSAERHAGIVHKAQQTSADEA